MKAKLLTVCLLFVAMAAMAQNDPVIMTINGQPVTRSEFEYSYNKNNAEGVIDKKTVEEYVELFVNYKLKVEAAKEERLDTMTSYLEEFATYRNQQVRPTFITDDDVEAEALRIYTETQREVDSLGGLIKPAHILLLVNQQATAEQDAAAKARIDSIYKALQDGADFAEMARQFSDDKNSAVRGGELRWFRKGQLVPEFENAAFALEKGQMSAPVRSVVGYHIILMQDKGPFFPYDSLHADILQFIEQRGLRESIIDKKLDELAAQQNTTPAALLEARATEMASQDPELKYLIQEYHDGLLLYEASNRNVWEKASQDEEALARFFKKNKKKYAWEQPHFKGIAYHTRDAADIKAVQKVLKGVSFDKWADVLRSTFNNDSILRIRVEKGIFRIGDNALVDREVFKKDTTVTPMKDYPYSAVFGKKLKAPQDYQDVRALVLADYQEQLEKDWVAALRKKYNVWVDESVLKTVNKH